MAAASTQGKNQKDTVAGATQVTKYSRMIISQGEIAHIKEIPNLPQHQQAAKTQSNDWVENIWPLIINTTADIIDYSNTFQATYSNLLDLVPQLKSGDLAAKEQFVKALEQVLIPNLESKKTASKDIADKITTFYNGFEGLYRDFVSDFSAADKVITADEPKIVALQKELKVWRDNANDYEYIIVGAAVAIPATVTATALLAETGVGVIVGGILVAGEIATIGTMLKLYADAMKKVNDLTSQINALQQQVAQLTAIEHQITGLQDSSKKVADAASSVSQAWYALHSDMTNTLDHLKSITPEEAAFIITGELDTANKDWLVVLQQATVLQPNGGRLDEKTFKTSDDMVKAIESQASGA